MKNQLAAVLLIAFSMTSLAACGEKPQAFVPAAKSGYKSEHWDSQMRERTLSQGEYGRNGD